MREALAARSGRDFVTAGPSSRKASSVLQAVQGALRVAARRPGAIAGGALLLVAASAVSLNALSFQTARHPAPLFGAKPRPEASSPRQVDATASLATNPPLPPTRPQPPVAVAPQLPIAAPAAPAVAPSLRVAAKPNRDPIGDMIRGGDAVAPASAAKPEAQKLVASAQRALAKLGYGPLKPDGVMGTGTRQAIERFERDRRLPASGELGARTLRELSAQAGLPVE